jgi:hypothetical protein
VSLRLRVGYLLRLVADGIEVLPFAAPQLQEQLAEARHARTLCIESWDPGRKVKPIEGASGLTDFRVKLPNQRGCVARPFGGQGRGHELNANYVTRRGRTSRWLGRSPGIIFELEVSPGLLGAGIPIDEVRLPMERRA